VAVNSNITKTLLEREWIRVVGYREVPGRPAMFATTKAFLDHFNLKNLDDLPPLAALRELEPEPMPVDVEDAPVPAHLQALADASLGDEDEPAAPRDETSFRTLLLELDEMEQGLKTDFDDLREPEPGPESVQQSEPEPEPAAEVETPALPLENPAAAPEPKAQTTPAPPPKGDPYRVGAQAARDALQALYAQTLAREAGDEDEDHDPEDQDPDEPEDFSRV
jgi:outer membrane biosynthesis protein TonB